MNEALQKTLSQLKWGEAQVFHNLTLFPLLDGDGSGPEYLMLGEALKQKAITVGETSEGGSVPELKVVNGAAVAVLLLDGEELVGAKQNRVLNMSILLKPKSETIINVSCTERGRWSYQSRHFNDSDVVMEWKVRSAKQRSVSASLKQSGLYCSDQGEVWERIDALRDAAGVVSPTGAMRDVFLSKEKDIEECLAAFPRVEGQVGFVFAVDGAVAGMDFVSRAAAYAHLHNKLVKSYVIDAKVRKDAVEPASPDSVRRFIEQITQCAETGYPSTGMGEDFRYEHDTVCGSALVCEDTCVHAAFFAVPPEEDKSIMYGFRRRRGFPMRWDQY